MHGSSPGPPACSTPGLLTCSGSPACCRPGVLTCSGPGTGATQRPTRCDLDAAIPGARWTTGEHPARSPSLCPTSRTDGASRLQPENFWWLFRGPARTLWSPSYGSSSDAEPLAPRTSSCSIISRDTRRRRHLDSWQAYLVLTVLVLLTGGQVAAGDGFCDPLLCLCGARAANCSYRGFLTVPTGLPNQLLTLGRKLSRYFLLLRKQKLGYFIVPVQYDCTVNWRGGGGGAISIWVKNGKKRFNKELNM
jgi:hypothetical protein